MAGLSPVTEPRLTFLPGPRSEGRLGPSREMYMPLILVFDGRASSLSIGAAFLWVCTADLGGEWGRGWCNISVPHMNTETKRKHLVKQILSAKEVVQSPSWAATHGANMASVFYP